MTTLTTGSPSTTTSTSGVASYAVPYAQQNLANAYSLSQQPYQPYQGQQNAAMTGLQNQAFTTAGNMGVNQNSIQAGNTAGQASNNLLNTSYNNPYTAQIQGWNNQAASDFMSPYVMQSLAPQLQLLQQQQGIQGNQLASQATQAGAFGGSRMGIQQGLQNQANQLAQNSLVGNAFNTAYNNAQQQFNTQNALGLQAQNANIAQQQFGANLGLQANTAAANAAATQSNIGNTQNSQAQNATVLQNQLGTEQQQYQQGLLNTQYQNYVNQLNYPYQQTAFLQNMINGYPVTTSSSTTQPSSPSYLQNLASLGIGAYGVSQLLAKGGQAKVKKYAGVGAALTSSGDSLTSVLEQGIADAQSIGDYPTVRALTAELNNMGGGAPQAAQKMPSTGAPQAGSYAANPNIGVSGLTGGIGQMGISGATGQRSAAMPGSTASGSNGIIPQDLQTLLQMKRDANKIGLTQQQQLMQQLDENGGLSSYFGADPSVASGLESIPLSEDVLPVVSKKRGGITDVARYNGEEDSVIKQAVASNMNDGSLDFGAPSTLNTTREDRGLPAVPVKQVLDVPNQQTVQQANTEAQQMRQGVQAGLQTGTPRDMANSIMASYTQHVPLTAEQRLAALGPAPTLDYQSLRDQLAKQQTANADNLKQGRGLAALAAIGPMLEGNQFGRGVGQAAGAFSNVYGGALNANHKAQENLVAMNMKLTQAEHADRLGLYKTKTEAINAAEKDAQEYDKNKATFLKDLYTADKASGIKEPEMFANVALALAKDPNNKELQAQYRALSGVSSVLHPAVLAADVTQGGANARNTANLTDADIRLRQQEMSASSAKAAEEFGNLKTIGGKKYKALVEAAGGDENQAREDYIANALRAQQNALNRTGAPLKDTSAPAPATNPTPVAGTTPTAGQPISVTAPNGVTYQFPTQKAADDFKKKAGIK